MYIDGTSPINDLWPDAPPERIKQEQRERKMLDILRGTRRSHRNPAVEIYCGCHKTHLVVSVFSLPEDEVAIWEHGGGRIPDGYLKFPDGNALAKMNAELGLPGWFKVPDSLSIVPLELLQVGKGWKTNITPRCDLPYTVNADDRVNLARIVEVWKTGDRNTPMRVHLAMND